jgi:hypothetical protein
MRAREACDSAKATIHHMSLSAAWRALASYANDPGVPLRYKGCLDDLQLRSTPGFMPTPRFAGSIKSSDKSFLKFVELLEQAKSLSDIRAYRTLIGLRGSFSSRMAAL